MILNIIHVVIGIYAVLKGADYLTDGAVALAQRFRMPQVLIGLTIVALGTSMPEFFVSVVSAINGVTDIAVANVVGSNIFNVLLIGGASAAIAPMTIMPLTVKRDVPVAIAASMILLFFGIQGEISFWHGMFLLLLLIAYTIYSIRTSIDDSSATTIETKDYTLFKTIGLIVLGLIGLAVGSHWFVNAASEIASQFGVSDAVIGLTIVAGGTSLPELATSIVAARKGQSAIAMGNILGSCVYNILFIIGVTGVICPMHIQGITTLDYATMLVSITLLWLFSFTKYKVERWEGIVLLTLFAAYMAALLYTI